MESHKKMEHSLFGPRGRTVAFGSFQKTFLISLCSARYNRIKTERCYLLILAAMCYDQTWKWDRTTACSDCGSKLFDLSVAAVNRYMMDWQVCNFKSLLQMRLKMKSLSTGLHLLIPSHILSYFGVQVSITLTLLFNVSGVGQQLQCRAIFWCSKQLMGVEQKNSIVHFDTCALMEKSVASWHLND